MTTARAGRACLYRRQQVHLLDIFIPHHGNQRTICVQSRQCIHRRTFTSSQHSRRQNPNEGESFTTRAGRAWRGTKIDWKPIPIALGIGFLGFFQFLRIRRREREGADAVDESGEPIPKRQRIRPSGGWQVQVMSTLPLKAVSRVWGWFNELTIPYYLRVPGFKLYGWIFGVNFDEVKEPDLHVFPNLAAFFYREIKDGVRPLDPNPRALLSPADGKVLQFGTIEHGEVEQVKGMTYKLDALLGQHAPSRSSSPTRQRNAATTQEPERNTKSDEPESVRIRKDEEFANVNGISYSLPNLFQGSNQSRQSRVQDQSTPGKASSEAAVQEDLDTTAHPWWSPARYTSDKPTKLYYLVVYLAPGDYHRFHSPVSWVCTSRRHFAGELYSVSPYVQKTLPGLFTLNERVVLLGQWKYGFFSYTPVGATNVGSIKINFDKELRTNSLTTDTEADRQAAAAAKRGEPYSGYSEATYENGSVVLGGFPLERGEEMGGFQLGSSIVMVFEAPCGERVHSFDTGGVNGEELKGGWRWNVERDQKVKVGQALGWVEEDENESKK